MSKILLEISPELMAALDTARDGTPRNPYIESLLWRLKPIKAGAAAAGVVNPCRPLEGRGRKVHLTKRSTTADT